MGRFPATGALGLDQGRFAVNGVRPAPCLPHSCGHMHSPATTPGRGEISLPECADYLARRNPMLLAEYEEKLLLRAAERQA